MRIHRYTDDGKDIGEEVFDISKSGPQLTQAEVEAAMKKVSVLIRGLCFDVHVT